MSGASRKGLKRLGMRRYLVCGPRGTWIIERERPWRFSVRPEGWPRDPRGVFFQMQFRRLRAARQHAEKCAGIEKKPVEPAWVTAKEARAMGLKWFRIPRACPAGHISKRSLSNYNCRSCVNAKEREERKTDPARLRAKDKQKYWKSPEKCRQIMRSSRQKHIEKRRREERDRYRLNPEVAAKVKARAREWRARNPEYLRHQTARRRAIILRAMPAWLTDAQVAEMRAIYASCPKGFEVDHIVPIRGKNVCGLHVPWNLQHLGKAANRSKGNRHG